MKTCRCCKYQFEKGKECPKCGFNMIQTFDDDAEKEELKLAEEYRRNLLDAIKAIRVQSYKYKVSAGKPVLSEKNSVIIAETGSDCYEHIIWSNETFAPTPCRKKDRRDLDVYYSVNEINKQIKVALPIENFDGVWSLGVMISEGFTIQLFLGNSDNCTESGKYRLELK